MARGHHTQLSKVSVVLPTYNGASRGFIRDAIESVVAQSEPGFELIIVDDGSTDNTNELCREYLSDPRVRVLRFSNAGVSAARNAGIAAATGPYVCFLDDDDVWKADKLSKQLDRFALGGKSLGLVYTAIEIIDERGNVVGMQSHPPARNVYRELFYENLVDATSSVMVRSEVLRAVGGFRADVFNRNLQACEDRELWIRIAKSYDVDSVEEPLVMYRTHGKNLSRAEATMEQGELRMLELALAEAPAEIRDERDEIYFAAYSRFAMKNFSLGNCREFRAKYRAAGQHGKAGLGLRLRFVASYAPGLVAIGRAVLRRGMRFK